MKLVRKLIKNNNNLLLCMPKEALQALNAQAGDSVVVIVENDKVEIKKVQL